MSKSKQPLQDKAPMAAPQRFLPSKAVRAIATIITALGLVFGFAVLGGAPADAAYCNSYSLRPFTDGSYGRTVQAPNGAVIGYSKNVADTCRNQWYSHNLLTNNNYKFTVYIWQPGQPAAPYWMGPWTNAYQNGPSIGIGRENCSGAHIYDSKGRWLRWQFFGCWRS
ncbi:hypothetical protein PV772_11155 [Pseudarthrobacter sp. CC12]|uniref:hypothetical protein n=1 Tax=Pseudarthrobacter sp. CC12 TaxID=3029193 RepID=UPI0032636AF7